MCQLQCRLEFAKKEAGCLPWDYPSGPGDSNVVDICQARNTSVNDVADFEAAMNSADSLETCKHCLPNCEEVNFEIQVENTTRFNFM